MSTAIWPPVDGDFDLVDLTHPLREGMPIWPTHPKFTHECLSSIEGGDVSSYYALCLGEHTGTHLDAPLHFVRGGRSIAEIPLQRFFGRLATIDARGAAPDSEASVEQLLAFESRHGAIREGDAVLFAFGWARFWEHPSEGASFFADWPGVSGAAARWLADRGVRLVGSDCLSIDRFSSSDYPAHNCLLRAEVLIGENFANLDRLPAWSSLVVMPLPIEGGSGSPVRAVALVPRGGATPA